MLLAPLIPIRVQDETKARRIPGCWRGASEAHIRSDLQRASNEASNPEDKRISLILNANWNQNEFAGGIGPVAGIGKIFQRETAPTGLVIKHHSIVLRPAV